MWKKPMVTEVRTPANTWRGLEFPEPMPAETLKELRRADHVSYKATVMIAFEVAESSLPMLPVCALGNREQSSLPSHF